MTVGLGVAVGFGVLVGWGVAAVVGFGVAEVAGPGVVDEVGCRVLSVPPPQAVSSALAAAMAESNSSKRVVFLFGMGKLRKLRVKVRECRESARNNSEKLLPPC